MTLSTKHLNWWMLPAATSLLAAAYILIIAFYPSHLDPIAQTLLTLTMFVLITGSGVGLILSVGTNPRLFRQLVQLTWKLLGE